MRIELLDHGYLQLVESWGSDEKIIEAARMSTGKGFQGWGGAPCPECLRVGRLDARDNLWTTGDSIDAAKSCTACKGSGKTHGDEKLLAYLWDNKHATPFEMAGLVVEVQAPIFVFREWHRHRTQSYNELSARYAPLPDVNYVPTIDRLMIGADGSNRQAGTVADAARLNLVTADGWVDELEDLYRRAENFYQRGLKIGVPKELARVIVPVGRYSRMRASANLRNWLAFLTLRMAPNAQWEIRQYANAVGSLIAKTFPRTWKLFAKGAA